MNKQFIILIGDIANGYNIFGPFASGADVDDFVTDNFPNEDWTVATLIDPMQYVKEAMGNED